MAVRAASGVRKILSDPSLPDGPLVDLGEIQSGTRHTLHEFPGCANAGVTLSLRPDRLVRGYGVSLCRSCFDGIRQPERDRAAAAWLLAATALAGLEKADVQLRLLHAAAERSKASAYCSTSSEHAQAAGRVIAAALLVSQHPYSARADQLVIPAAQDAANALTAVTDDGGQFSAQAAVLAQRVAVEAANVTSMWSQTSAWWTQEVAAKDRGPRSEQSRLLALNPQFALPTTWAELSWAQPGHAAMLTSTVLARGDHISVVELTASAAREVTRSLSQSDQSIPVPADGVDLQVLRVAVGAMDCAWDTGAPGSAAVSLAEALEFAAVALRAPSPPG